MGLPHEMHDVQPTVILPLVVNNADVSGLCPMFPGGQNHPSIEKH